MAAENENYAVDEEEDEEFGFQMVDGLSFEDNLQGEPTTSHYVDKRERQKCYNPACQCVFSLTVRPHHCRRCGEVFCTNCLRYRRRLNKMAQLDPEGLPFKVCRSCFEVGLSTLGRHRSHTAEFLEWRRTAKENRRHTICSEKLADVQTSLYPAFWRNQISIDIPSECHRLLRGFKAALAKSETKKVMKEMTSMVKVPKWQKSTYWKLEKLVEFCRVCRGKLGYRKSYFNCKVCGMAMCKRCACKELLVFVDDSQVSDGVKSIEPRLAIIRVIGCPELEPDLSVLLHVCAGCKQAIKERQLEDQEWFKDKPRPPDVATRLAELDEEIRVVREQISNKLSEYNEMLDPPNTCYPEDMKNHMTDPQDLEKLEKMKAGLEEDFSKLETLCAELRSINNQSDSAAEAVLFKNYVKGRYDFYMEHRHVMGRLIRRNKSILAKRNLVQSQEAPETV